MCRRLPAVRWPDLDRAHMLRDWVHVHQQWRLLQPVHSLGSQCWRRVQCRQLGELWEPGDRRLPRPARHGAEHDRCPGCPRGCAHAVSRDANASADLCPVLHPDASSQAAGTLRSSASDAAARGCAACPAVGAPDGPACTSAGAPAACSGHPAVRRAVRPMRRQRMGRPHVLRRLLHLPGRERRDEPVRAAGQCASRQPAGRLCTKPCLGHRPEGRARGGCCAHREAWPECPGGGRPRPVDGDPLRTGGGVACIRLGKVSAAPRLERLRVARL
mmetsp:Transcript_50468/g.150944  ORF Transcript_50468/g.150944 Transcript_50468/m.150944 type:complete len:273 (-) Transcript_50468:148-966(-)